MKKRVPKKPLRKVYKAPKLVVYGKVVDLTKSGGRHGRKGRRHGGGSRS